MLIRWTTSSSTGPARFDIQYGSQMAELTLDVPAVAPKDESTQMPTLCEPLLRDFACALLSALDKKNVHWQHR